MPTISAENLTEAQKLFVCWAINEFGSKQCSWAAPDNLHFFAVEGAKDAIRVAIHRGLSPQAVAIAKSLGATELSVTD